MSPRLNSSLSIVALMSAERLETDLMLHPLHPQCNKVEIPLWHGVPFVELVWASENQQYDEQEGVPEQSGLTLTGYVLI